MIKKLLYLLILASSIAFSQNYHSTQGKLDISSSGQSSYTIPVALPPTIADLGPVINLVYTSGQTGGIAGEGWSISSVSNISRMGARKDIDNYKGDIRYDNSDKLSLEGQRLLLVSGTYWANGSVYQTEILSNKKIECKIQGSNIYFIVSNPDGSRAWYGNYGGLVGSTEFSFNIVRFEDKNGNFITYHYTKPLNKSLCINEIKFSGNVIDFPTPLNKIKFNYQAGQRNELGFIKGIKKESNELLKNIEVSTNNSIFRRYDITHEFDERGYARIKQVQEFNGAGEPANPIVFQYDTTTYDNSNSQISSTYYNDIDLTDINHSGDFDGDGRLDFISDNKLFTKLFETQTGAPAIPLHPEMINILYGEKIVATTISNGKLNQFQSIVQANRNPLTIDFKVFNLQGQTFSNSYNKIVNIDTEGEYGEPIYENIYCPSNDCEYIASQQWSGGPDTPPVWKNFCNENNPVKNIIKYYEGDYNSDGISEIFIVNEKRVRNYHYRTYIGESGGTTCDMDDSTVEVEYFLLNLDPTKSSSLGTDGFIKLPNTFLLNEDFKFEERFLGDFNGDGKTDILVISRHPSNFAHYAIFSFKELSSVPWIELEVIGQGAIDRYGPSKQLLLGDYNGDGKTDIMISDTAGGKDQTLWNIYYSNGSTLSGDYFYKKSFNIVEYWPDTGGEYKLERQTSNYYALDTNKDGKTDLVRVWRRYYKPSNTINDHDTQWSVTSYANNIANANNFVLDYSSPCIASLPFPSCKNWNDSPDLPIPIVSSYKFSSLNNELLMVRNHGNTVTYIKFPRDIGKDNMLKKVSSDQDNIIEEITYQSMEASSSNNGFGLLTDFYSSTNSLNYPYIEIRNLPTTKLVSKLSSTVEGVSKYQDFKYHGYVANLNGLGVIGFNKVARSSWYQDNSQKTLWNVTENNSAFRGATYRTYTQLVDAGLQFSFVLNTQPSSLINSTVNEQTQSTVNGVYKFQLDKQTSKDYQTNVVNETTYQYNPVFLLPEKQILKNYLGNSTTPTGTFTTTTLFENNPAGQGSDYFIGRVKKSTNLQQAYINAISADTEYFYENNRIKKIKKRGNTTSAKFIVEEFEYDTVGNILKNTASSEGYDTTESISPQIVEYTYDSTKRFTKTVKDVEGFVSTNEIISPNYGIVTQHLSPFGLTTKTLLDNWGKVVKTTDYLGKTNSTTYSKSGGNYVTMSSSESGLQSKVVKDVLGRTKQSSKKNIDGTWTHQDYLYDFLSRNYKTSEPYTTSTPTHWTTIVYDDLGRQITTTSPSNLVTTTTYDGLSIMATDGLKTVGITKNANGHTVSNSDNGGAITHTYYANGNLKNSLYSGTLISIEYDEWGRKKKLSDPSAGIYEYKYNAVGVLLKEITPNGTSTNKYDAVGKILESTIIGTNTNTKTTYEYNPTTKLVAKIKLTDNNDSGKIQEHRYNYDSYNRLNETFEQSGNILYQRVTLFDDFGRPEQEAYVANFNGKQSHKWVKNTYKNGYHWQTLDLGTNLVLWQTNTVNEKGSLKTGMYGNNILVANNYDEFGFPTESKHYLSNNSTNPTMKLNTTFEPQRGNLLFRSNSMFQWNETLEYDNLDRLKKYNNAQGLQVEQQYEQDGRISANPIGSYKYENSAKKYQQTSLALYTPAVPYFENRQGVFNDDFELKDNWLIYEPSVFTYDTGVAKSGSRSLKITNPGPAEKYVHSEIWTKIDNAVPTKYTYSAWVKSDGSNPQAEILLFMKTETETGYYTIADNKTVSTNSEWTYVEKTFLVPAHIKKLNVRLDSNAAGTIWYDNVNIKLTDNLPTDLRQLNITYNTFKSPYEIEETGLEKISFTYNFMNNRNAMYYGGTQSDKSQRRYFKSYSADGSMEVKHNTATNEIEFITYIDGTAYSAAVVLKSNGTTSEYLYLHRDYQGTILAISNQAGVIVEKRLFDAWGQILKIQDGQGNTLQGLKVLDRGYTGHEHLESVGLINMNGRIYDPMLHRFLQPDNNIQDPTNTQNYNRYGYVYNNPFKYTDPSGEIAFLPIIVGALIAAASYTMTALLTDVPFTAFGFIGATFMGAVGGAVSGEIGTIAKGIEKFGEKIVFQMFAHGISQSLLSGVQGGDMLQSFVSGALSSIVSSAWAGGDKWKGVGGNFAGSDVGTLVFGTAAGAGGAALTKGNIWQGAAIGLVVSGLNHFAHKNQMRNKIREKLSDPDGIPKISVKAVKEVKAQVRGLFNKDMIQNEHEPTIEVGGSKGNTAGSFVYEMSDYGHTTPNTTLRFYTSAFKSNYILARTILHEYYHMGDFYSGKAGTKKYNLRDSGLIGKKLDNAFTDYFETGAFNFVRSLGASNDANYFYNPIYYR